MKEKIGMGAVKAPILLLSGERQFILDIIVVFGVEIFAGDKPDVRIGRFVHENVEERGDFSVVVADGFGIVLGVGEIDSQPCRKFVVIRDGLSQSDEGWCRRILDKQSSVIVERRFEIIKECAMLFESHHEGIDFIGYSLFESRNGAYSRNILASNEDIKDMIAGYIPRDTLTSIRENLTSILSDTLTGHYEGFLGVDQMICQADFPVFIPVSEINLRMTMGLIARNQYDNARRRPGI